MDEEKSPEDLFKEATDLLWTDEDVTYGYVTVKNGRAIWHLPDTRNLVVRFEEITLTNL